MRAIKVAFSTMGASSPATVAEDASGTSIYLYHGDPKRSPGHPDYVPGRRSEDGPPIGQHPANARRLASRKDRVARYCELRAEGVSRAEAAAEVEVGTSAAKTYEAEYRKQQQEAQS